MNCSFIAFLWSFQRSKENGEGQLPGSAAPTIHQCWCCNTVLKTFLMGTHPPLTTCLLLSIQPAFYQQEVETGCWILLRWVVSVVNNQKTKAVRFTFKLFAKSPAFLLGNRGLYYWLFFPFCFLDYTMKKKKKKKARRQPTASFTSLLWGLDEIMSASGKWNRSENSPYDLWLSCVHVCV